jgi:hypothetical protein
MICSTRYCGREARTYRLCLHCRIEAQERRRIARIRFNNLIGSMTPTPKEYRHLRAICHAKIRKAIEDRIEGKRLVESGSALIWKGKLTGDKHRGVQLMALGNRLQRANAFHPPEACEGCGKPRRLCLSQIVGHEDYITYLRRFKKPYTQIQIEMLARARAVIKIDGWLCRQCRKLMREAEAILTKGRDEYLRKIST